MTVKYPAEPIERTPSMPEIPAPAEHTHTLQFVIECGATTCAYEKGKFCRYLGVRRMGSENICLLFPSEQHPYTPLQETAEGGWLLRCAACLRHERG